ncbi:hypothetical protein ILUMI_04334, partial [Ignelater luminosus]
THQKPELLGPLMQKASEEQVPMGVKTRQCCYAVLREDKYAPTRGQQGSNPNFSIQEYSQDMNSHSVGNTVLPEMTVNPTGTAPLKVVAILTATVPQTPNRRSATGNSVPPGGVLLQVKQASTSTVVNPPGVACTFTGGCRESFKEHA